MVFADRIFCATGKTRVSPHLSNASRYALKVTSMAPGKGIRSITDVAYRAQESARDTYLAACASIGSYLEKSFGFKYSKSGPHTRRRSGDFTFQIAFQSSSYNVRGHRVALWIHGTVLSSRIKKWRKSQPFLHALDYIAGGQLGNLQTNHRWLNWDLANASKRDQVIRDAIRAIEELAFPYFAKFDDLPSLFNLLVNEDLPAMAIDHAVEFLMCCADQSTARLAAANFLKRRPDLVLAYQREFKTFSQRGLDAVHPSGYAIKQLAVASHAFNFGDLTAEGCTTNGGS